MNCNFKVTKLPEGGYLHQCQNIGCTLKDRIIKTEGRFFRQCNAPEKSIKNKIKRFIKSLIKWIFKGRPKRSKKQVDQIFNEHCRPCPQFNKIGKYCNICGCRCKKDNGEFLNKIKWATEHCPLKKW